MKLLALNRGEIAIRIFRAANELGLKTVAIFSAEDRLSLHRFKGLGLLDSEGHASGGAGALALPGAETTAASTSAPLIAGQACPSCGAHAYIKRDGCMFCTACGHQGECG